jgi:hypothetical protein
MAEFSIKTAYCFLERAADYSKSSPVAEALINVGDNVVRIVVPAADLALSTSFLNAFYNAAEASTLPQYTIRVFDDSDGHQTDVFPFEEHLFDATGKLSIGGAHYLKLSVNPVIGSISVCDWQRREIAVWIREFKHLPYWFVATPLRDEIAAIADMIGMDFIHAAGLGRGREGVCIVGRSGSGKTTTVLKGVLDGLQTVGDDFLLTDGQRLFGVYSRAKAHRDAQQLAGDFSGAVIGGQNEAKLILDLGQLGGGKALVPDMEITAICLPNRGAGRGLVAAKRMDVVRELLVHTSIGLREVYPDSLMRMRSLADSAPCWNWFLEREGCWLEEGINLMLEAHAGL